MKIEESKLIGIKIIEVKVSRTYKLKFHDHENPSEEYLKKLALSELNNDLQFGLLEANEYDFNVEIIK